MFLILISVEIPPETFLANI